jgi:hypothetical protein
VVELSPAEAARQAARAVKQIAGGGAVNAGRGLSPGAIAAIVVGVLILISVLGPVLSFLFGRMP